MVMEWLTMLRQQASGNRITHVISPRPEVRRKGFYVIVTLFVVMLITCSVARGGQMGVSVEQDRRDQIQNGIVLYNSGAGENTSVRAASEQSVTVHNEDVLKSDIGREPNEIPHVGNDDLSDLSVKSHFDARSMTLKREYLPHSKQGHSAHFSEIQSVKVYRNHTFSQVNVCYHSDKPGGSSAAPLHPDDHFNIPPLAQLKVSDNPQTKYDCCDKEGCGLAPTARQSCAGGRSADCDWDNAGTNTPCSAEQAASVSRDSSEEADNVTREGVFEQKLHSAENCRDPRLLNFTFVTGLFDLHRENWPHFQRTFDHYLSYSVQLLQMNVPLVAYIDSKSVEFVKQHRQHKEHFTKLIVSSIEDLEYYEDYDTIKDIMDSEEFQTDHAFLNHPEAFSPEYNILLNSKSSLLHKASQDNPFKSTHFFWVDIGYGHGEHIYPENCDWAPKRIMYNETVGDRITFIQLNPVSWLSSIFEVYKQKIPPFLNGGFFGGSLEAVQKYYNLHKDMYKLFLLHRMTDDDQTIAIVCYFEQRELFNLMDGWWYDAFKLF